MNESAKYKPLFIEKFARDTIGVREQHVLDKIQSAYDDWYFNRTRTAVSVNQDSQPDAVNICFSVRTGGTEINPKKAYISLNKDTGRVVMREQRIHNQHLMDMSDIEVATLTHADNFGYTEEGRNNGKYLHRSMNSPYQESFFKHLQDFTGSASWDSADDLARSIAIIAGDWDIENDRYKDYDETYNNYSNLRPHAYAVERDHIRKGFRELLLLLDQKALKVLYRARLPVPYLYGWLVGQTDFGDMPVVDFEACRRRQDAAHAFPMLMVEMAHSVPFSQAIDKEDAILENVRMYITKNCSDRDREDDFEMPKETLKWLYGKKAYLVDGTNCGVNPRIYNAVKDLRWMSALPREWRPRNHVEYQSYVSIYYQIGDHAKLTGRGRDELFRELVSALSKPKGLPQYEIPATDENGEIIEGAKPEIETFFEAATPIQKMVVKNAAGSKSRFELSGNDKDFLRRLGEQVVLPEIITRFTQAGISLNELLNAGDEWHDCDPTRYSLAGKLTQPTFEGMSVIKVMTSSKRWHNNAARLEDRTGFIEKAMEWEPLIEPLIAPNGVRIRALTSTEQLKQMGDKMSNCIGGYSFHCAVKSSHILVLDAGNGDWTTNLELRDNQNHRGRNVSQVQHELSGNQLNIPEEAIEAAKWIQDTINDGELSVDWDRIDKTRTEHKKDQLLIKIGFDPISLEARERSYEAWHGTMPDLMPETNRGDFLKRIGVHDRLDKIINNLKADKDQTLQAGLSRFSFRI